MKDRMESNQTASLTEDSSAPGDKSLSAGERIFSSLRGHFRRPDKSLLLRVIPPPLIVAAVMLVMSAIHKMYPFGTGAMSWCDMSQQVVPLLNQFKDMLESGSESSVFFSFKAGSGMSMYGVYFFNLASPFTYLVKFVRREDMLMFANVLITIKMSCCALTSSICFTACRKKLGAGAVILLSVMYPFCGYTMLYYQNIPWLDMMYLFPLLIIALKRLFADHKPLMYIIVLAYSMYADFYICAMLIIFVLLYAGVYMLMNGGNIMHDMTARRRLFRTGRDLFIGSLTAALISAFVWLPCFMQYRTSIRTAKKLRAVLAESEMVPPYTTMLPVLLCTGFAAAVLLVDIFSKRRRSRGNDQMLILLGLTLIPFAIEPINKVWHLGSYICFPGRFGYMTIYLALYCCGYALESLPEYKPTAPKYFVWSLLTVISVLFFRKLSDETLRDKHKQVSKYVNSLWGDEDSLKLLLGLFFLAVIAYGLIYLAHHKGVFNRTVFLCLSGLMLMLEISSNMNIYMTFPAEENAEQNIKRGNIYSISGKIEDDSFWRMKSYSKVFDNNIIGAMGYNTISHYTSLTDMNYATAMKTMGYSTNGLEVASVGGTRLTDALLSVRYEINGGISHSTEVYNDSNAFIHRLPDYLPMGIILDRNALDGAEELPADGDRAEVQRFISERIFGEDITERYQPAEGLDNKGGKYRVSAGTVLHYTIDVTDERTIYLDCCDGMSTRYKESFFDAIKIKINGSERGSSYPVAVNSGVLRLGDFENMTVNIDLTFTKSVSVSSLGLFGIDVGRMEQLIGETKGAYLNTGDGILSGSVSVSEPCTCFLSLPYNEGFTVKVNGRKTTYRRVLTGFTALDLEAGQNDIKITFVPTGFIPGIIITAAGAGVLALYLVFRRKLDKSSKFDGAAWFVMTGASAAVFTAVYIMPLYVNIFK